MNLENITRSRYSWALLSFFSFFCVFAAIFFQEYFDMKPCYLCIIQRIAFLVIGFSSLIVAIYPQKVIRKFGYLGWFAGSSIGVFSGAKLVYTQENPPLFSSCGMDANVLMEKYSFLDYIPILFEGSGDCTKSAGNFLSITFEQWTLTLFVLLILTFFFFAIKRGLEITKK